MDEPQRKTRALPGLSGVAIDPATRASHLHEWLPAPNPRGNRAERRRAAKLNRRRNP